PARDARGGDGDRSRRRARLRSAPRSAAGGHAKVRPAAVAPRCGSGWTSGGRRSRRSPSTRGRPSSPPGVGRPLDGALSARLSPPVRFANDANCFALSEAVDGAGAGARVVFGVIVGTGTGGGIVIDSRLWTGPHAIA